MCFSLLQSLKTQQERKQRFSTPPSHRSQGANTTPTPTPPTTTPSPLPVDGVSESSAPSNFASSTPTPVLRHRRAAHPGNDGAR